ncbi:MAG: translation initiation factor IF-2 [Clostridia bacterium]|nr:translation initiation factor IF-2 [Clostridia bacterium]
MAVSTNKFVLNKLNTLAKDLGKKSKDLADVLVAAGVEVKTTTKTLEPLEFEILFDALTQANQITDIGSYLDGVTYIPSKVKKAEPKAEPKEEAAPEKKTEQAEPKSASAEAKQPKEETKPAEKPEEGPAEPQKEVKTEPEAEKRPAQRQPYTGNPYHRETAGAFPPARPSAPQTQRPASGAPAGRPAPSQDRFATSARPASGTTRPGASSFDRFPPQRPAGQGFGGDRRPAQKGGQGRGGKPGSFGDKGDYVASGPRDTFKAQPIVRGASSAVNPDGTRKGPRVIDTHGSTVDLSKYDERLDSFVSDQDRIQGQGGSQRVKKQTQGQNNFARQNNKPAKGKGKGKFTPSPVVTVKPTQIEIPTEIVVGQLASKLMVTAGEVVKKLMMMGMMATINQVIDFDTAALVADEFGVTATPEVVVSIEEKLFDETEDAADELVTRAPVVCVMGHVDHGKTSILDAIRHTNVTSGEAGGITQAIGAYRVSIDGKEITFLDTPGHAAFTAMRARGAMATDIAILVVAADDGVMPQTVEAINHAKAAGVDIIVAINKMDKPGANPDAIKQELTKYDLVPEEWGGDVICVPVSALTGMGISDLLESVLLVAEVKDLRANPNRRGKGVVIEAKLDKGRGPVATVLVQNGTLRNGDIIIAGSAVGRVRSMVDHNGKPMKAAGPSVPVEITGLSEVPSAGDDFQAVEDERMARTLADQRRDKAKEDVFKANARASLNDLFEQISEGVKTLNIIVKADVDGSVEAVKASLEKLSNEEVKVHVIHAAAGGITEGDVTFAAASNAIIIGFNVRPDKSAMDSAERQNVEIRTYRIIYECIEEVQAAMKGMLAPKFKENLLGHAEVRQTIHVPNVGTIAGSYVQDGKITRQSQIRVLRDGVVIFEDKISSLKRFKDDAREVAAGYECGVGLEKFNDIKVGDILEAYIMEQLTPEL